MEKKEETINDRVRMVRKALGMTQQEFAHKMKLKSGNTFSMIERGESNVTDQNIYLICNPNFFIQGLQVNYLWLKYGDNSEEAKQQPMFIVSAKPGQTIIYDKDGRELPRDEGELVGVYRQLTKPNKAVARKQIDALLEGQEDTAEKGEKQDREPEALRKSG